MDCVIWSSIILFHIFRRNLYLQKEFIENIFKDNMTDTTSIDDLPGVPASAMHGSGIVQNQKPEIPVQTYNPNISGAQLQQQQQQPQLQGPSPQTTVASNMNVNEFVSGLQRATTSGLTALPVRDVPRNTEPIISDQQTVPNYIPKDPVDYIREHHENTRSFMEHRARSANQSESLDIVYDTLQVPILLAILYFTFQLPVMRKYLLLYLPSIFNKDGNHNLSGLLFISILFSCTYYGINFVLNQFVLESE